MKKIKIRINRQSFCSVIKVVIAVLVSCYIFIAPLTVFKTLQAKQNVVNKEIDIKYMGILEMWNIDTFEGGSKSRTSFLEKQALKFEKISTGTFIMVSNMTVEQAKLNLQNGIIPDLISFGIGIGDDLLEYLSPLSETFNVRKDILNGGKCNDIQYAIPYILGGYNIVSDTNSQIEINTSNNCINSSMGFGGKSFNNSLMGLVINNIQCKNIYENSLNIDSFTCYDKYLSKHFDTLIGTQRDLYRIENRIQKGNMQNRNFCFLPQFSDLVQYVGICSKDEIKKEISLKFIKELLSEQCQETLKDINMFSVLNKKVFSQEDELFFEMEKTLSKELKTLNVFLTDAQIQNVKQLCLKAICGDENSKAKAMEYLV